MWPETNLCHEAPIITNAKLTTTKKKLTTTKEKLTATKKFNMCNVVYVSTLLTAHDCRNH